MITTVIGRQFLTAYNAAHGLHLSVADYFEERFIPLFFDHPKYLTEGGNSPLGNSLGKLKKVSSDYRIPPHERVERINSLLSKIYQNPAGSSPIGFHTTDPEATTSGQVSGVTMNPTTEEAMLSWVGAALGIGVKGGLLFLIPVDEVLLLVERGWHVYRRLLTERAEIRPNQANTWNGQWMRQCSRVDLSGEPEDSPFPSDVFSVDKGIMSVETVPWTEILLPLAKLLPVKLLTVYIYKLGGTGNTTVGFIPVDLSGLKRPIDVYQKLFGKDEYSRNQVLINNIFSTGFSLDKVCRMGTIGTYALLPKGLRGVMPASKPGGKTKQPDFSKNDNSLTVTYHVYISWLLAMLNDETLWSRAEEAADLLVLHKRSTDKKTSTVPANEVTEVLQANSRKAFIAALIPIAQKAPDDRAAMVRSLAQRVDTMPPDNLPYFVTLMRFCYALAERPKPATQPQTALEL